MDTEGLHNSENDKESKKMEEPSIQISGNDKELNLAGNTGVLGILLQFLPICVILMIAFFGDGNYDPNAICENLLAMTIIDLGTMVSAQNKREYGSVTVKPLLDSSQAICLLVLIFALYMILKLGSLKSNTTIYYCIVIGGAFIYYLARIVTMLGREK